MGFETKPEGAVVLGGRRSVMTYREGWTFVHGLVLGLAFLLTYAWGLAGLWRLRPALIGGERLRTRMRRVVIGTWAMAAVAWVMVVTGTWIVYPWYREDVPSSPRSLLLADPDRSGLHTFGMEWKEHVAWIAPLLATAVAFIVMYYRRDPGTLTGLRRTLMVTLTAAFVLAAIAGALGILISGAEPVN